METPVYRSYAIRTGDHVEFRLASSPPIARVSKLTKNIKVEGLPTKLVLKQTFYVGGKVRGVCKYHRFQVAAKPYGIAKLDKDTMTVVPKALRLSLLKECL